MNRFLPILNNPRSAVYFIGLVFMTVGLAFSKAIISLSFVLIASNWLFDKTVFNKLKTFFKDKKALGFSAIYLIFLLGLLYTENYSFAFGDIRTKLPILLFPLLISTSPKLGYQDLKTLLLVFVASVTASISVSIYNIFFTDILFFRDAFPFVSHIRLSISVVISLSILLYYSVSKNRKSRIEILVFLLLALYLIFSLIVLELMSGVVLLSILVITTLIYIIVKNRNHAKLILFFIFIFGNNYSQLDYMPYENGNRIGLNVCWKELEKEWNRKSDFKFDGKDKANQDLKFTLIRYLNSKSLSKDSVGFSFLNEDDIEYIENGVANHEYVNDLSYKKRLYKIFWEIGLKTKNANMAGHSVMQRFTLWETAFELILERPLFGFGTGDIADKFGEKLYKNGFQLENFNNRPHNQFLSFFITYGFVGALIIIFLIFYPPINLKAFSSYLFLSFFITMLFSMLWEDTLETHVGVNLFMFFYSVYLFGIEHSENDYNLI